MRAVDVVIKKREGETLSPAELKWFIDGYVDGTIADYQASAFLMATLLRGMTFQETAALTRAMIGSGETYDLSFLKGTIPVDKHSTGGVGDKVSLILAPLAAACGCVVPMVSGRGLGHTGGTLDKLEAIPGFQVNLGRDRFYRELEQLGVAMIGQSEKLVPADKKLYALRDVTGTVESVPLICASILSKKVASGAKALAMDVKCGSGAFMSDRRKALELAGELCKVGAELGLRIHALITNMEQPLGRFIGNSLELVEAIECLKGGGPKDLRELTIELAAEMLVLTNIETNLESARARSIDGLDSGRAFERFVLMVKAQHGDISVIEAPRTLDIAGHKEAIKAIQSGYVSAMNCREIGNAAVLLGAGRAKTTDAIDYGVGLEMHVTLGEKVTQGDALATIWHRNDDRLSLCRDRLAKAITISENPPAPIPLILDRIG